MGELSLLFFKDRIHKATIFYSGYFNLMAPSEGGKGFSPK